MQNATIKEVVEIEREEQKWNSSCYRSLSLEELISEADLKLKGQGNCVILNYADKWLWSKDKYSVKEDYSVLMDGSENEEFRKLSVAWNGLAQWQC